MIELTKYIQKQFTNETIYNEENSNYINKDRLSLILKNEYSEFVEKSFKDMNMDLKSDKKLINLQRDKKNEKNKFK